MVHDQFNIPGFGIVTQLIHVEVRIRSYKIEDVIFGMAVPVFPPDIPSFNQHSIEPVCLRKVDELPHVCIIGTVCSVWLRPGIICNTNVKSYLPELLRKQKSKPKK